MKIAFEGLAGCHAEAAIQPFLQSMNHPSYPQHPLFPLGTQAERVPCPSLDAICQKLTQTPPSVDLAFVPIENSHSGTFMNVYDSLVQYNNRVHIVGEWVCHQPNCLMVLKDSPIQSQSDIAELYSHQHVLDQCRQLVDRIQWERESKKQPRCLVRSMDGSALAAQWVQQQQLKHAAVLGNRKAADVYGLRVLSDGVENDQRSATRYLILANTPLSSDQLAVCSQTTTNKTSIAVSLKNASGQLFRALSAFALRDLNITKMESRPSPRASSSFISTAGVWEYVNYIDVEGGLDNINMRRALAQLQEFANQVKVLGSYPRFSGNIDASTSLGSPLGGPYMSM